MERHRASNLPGAARTALVGWLLVLALAPAATAGPAYPSFLKRQGRAIVDPGGAPVVLRGAAFGNQVWTDTRLPTLHHGEADFGRVASMGMNSVRFYLHYRTFESDARPYQYLPDGWAWLDTNIAWARKHRVWLILNMHVPQGGFQSLSKGHALWEVPENRRRLKALWHAIALRYKHEPVLGAFDLLNEPGVSRSPDQWKQLAQELVDTIRTADPRRLLIVERTNSVNGDWSEDADRNHFLVKDANTAYTFHFYHPFEYSHQYASWIPGMGEGGRYPDPDVISVSHATEWVTGSFDSPRVAAGSTGWTFYRGARLKAAAPKHKLVKPAVVSARNSGTLWADDLVLREFDPAGKPTRAMPLGLDAPGGWWFWSADGKGVMATDTAGCRTGGCLRISGTVDDANAGGTHYRMETRPGYSYALEGWLKGADLPAPAGCQLRVDFESVPGGIQRRDKAYLAAQVDAHLAFGARHNVPMYLGEFGVIDSCFRGGRGGLAWVSDMLDIAAERGLSFTYHDYHEDAFGIYRGSGAVDTSRANQELIRLFRAKLASPARPAAPAKAAESKGRKP